jgi:hypothetical protein
MSQPLTINQLAELIATSISQDNVNGMVCEFSIGTDPLDAEQKKKCYKIVDGMYVQIPCWAEENPQHT